MDNCSFDERIRMYDQIKNLRNQLQSSNRELLQSSKQTKSLSKQLMKVNRENEILRARMNQLPMKFLQQNIENTHTYYTNTTNSSSASSSSKHKINTSNTSRNSELEEMRRLYDEKSSELKFALYKISDLELSVRLLEEASHHAEVKITEEWEKIINEKKEILLIKEKRKNGDGNNGNDGNDILEDTAITIIDALSTQADNNLHKALQATKDKEVLSMAMLDALNRERIRSKALQEFINNNTTSDTDINVNTQQE